MTETYVLDTGVVIRWFVEQVGFEHAREVHEAYLEGRTMVETVDFVRVEVADVLQRKGLRPGHLDLDTYVSAVRIVDDLEIPVHRTDADSLERCARLCARTPGLRFYDAVVVDRAIVRRATLLTADVRLVAAVDSLLSTELLRGLA